MLETILIVAIVMAVFFTLLFITKTKHRLSDILIGLWLIALAVHILFIIINFNGQANTEFLIFSISFTLLHGPFLLLYTKSIIEAEEGFKLKQAFHFFPFLAGALIGVILYLSGINLSLFQKLVAIAGMASGTIYTVVTLHSLWKYQFNIKGFFSYTEKVNLNWLFNLTIGLLIIWIGASVLGFLSRILSMDLPLNWAFIIVPIFIFYIGFFAIRQKIIFTANSNESLNNIPPDIIKKFNQENTYRKSGLDKKDMKKILAKLMETMQNQKLYLTPKLTLLDLSEKLNVPPHHITQTLNTLAGQTFYVFVNHYRIKAFKKEVVDPKNQHYSLIAIALDCGFNSKSSFNRIFKEFTNLTPSAYKNMLSKNSI